MPFSASISSPSSSSLSLLSIQTRSPLSFFTPKTLIFTRTTIPHLPSSSLLASRRPRDFINGKDDFVDDTRNWNRKIKPEYGFVENVFRKISKRARKAVRSILPVSISTKLVGFSVNGVLILAFLWILKAFLEVACTLGTIVFTSILLIRGLWAGVAYVQESRNNRINELADDPRAWNGVQPAS
ncbi:unnamed protein product [Arabis nemorensis]|uniref:Uncharacterized protein n=1 Tax=Arabis nemorensis TaxID=586526 RepID=A0A565CA71_9BRAS|nr:unnamed protein product [Arabis nemorensis]